MFFCGGGWRWNQKEFHKGNIIRSKAEEETKMSGQNRSNPSTLQAAFRARNSTWLEHQGEGTKAGICSNHEDPKMPSEQLGVYYEANQKPWKGVETGSYNQNCLKEITLTATCKLDFLKSEAGLLWFHINFRIVCSSSVTNDLGNLIGIAENVYIYIYIYIYVCMTGSFCCTIEN